MQRNQVLSILENIEGNIFLESTYIASDYPLVAHIVGKTPEILYLLEFKEQSFPLVLERYIKNKAGMEDETLLAYFVFFNLCGNQQAMSELVSYLLSCDRPPEERVIFFSPWHPFFHAATALSKLSHNLIPVPEQEEVEDHLDRFFERIRQLKTSKNV